MLEGWRFEEREQLDPTAEGCHLRRPLAAELALHPIVFRPPQLEA